MAAFFHDRDSACLRLAAPSHNPSVHDDGLLDGGAEIVADYVVIAGEPFVDAHTDNSPGRQSQRLRQRWLVRLSLRLRVRLLLLENRTAVPDRGNPEDATLP